MNNLKCFFSKLQHDQIVAFFNTHRYECQVATTDVLVWIVWGLLLVDEDAAFGLLILRWFVIGFSWYYGFIFVMITNTKEIDVDETVLFILLLVFLHLIILFFFIFLLLILLSVTLHQFHHEDKVPLYCYLWLLLFLSHVSI